APWMPDRTEANPNELNQDDARYGFRCCHLKNIWTAPLPPETELSRQMTTSTTSIDIMGLQASYVNLLTDNDRDYFMPLYTYVIVSVWCIMMLKLICIQTNNVSTTCSVTMMLFLHLEVKPLMTLTTVLYLSCALISGHLAMMLMELTKRR